MARAYGDNSGSNPEKIYDIIQPLGRGSFGKVYKAMDKRDGELVALKIIPKQADIGSLQAEVQILKKCKSVYIVNFRDFFTFDNSIWLVMEYCGGGAISDIMKVTGEHCTEDQIQVILRECLKGIHYLHSQKVIHRDIKGGNILVNHRGQCKLADFGVSKNLDHTLAQAGTKIGSPYWMAPEMFSNNNYGNGVDLWSLGITAIELATGKPPHFDLHPMRAILTIPRSEPPTLPPGPQFTQNFRDFLAHCLVKQPNSRPTAQQLLRHQWIRKARGLRVIQDYVARAAPKLDEFRQQLRQDDDDDDDGPDSRGGTGTGTGMSTASNQSSHSEPRQKPLPRQSVSDSDSLKSVFVSDSLDYKTDTFSSKAESIAYWNQMKKQHNKDKKKLEDYYSKNLRNIEQRIQQLQ